MGLILSKVLPALLFPIGLVCLLCLVTGILALLRKAKSAAILAFSAAGILYLSASPVVCHILLRGLEGQYAELESYPKASAIVLLGGAMIPPEPPRLHPATNSSGDRVLQATRLWRRGIAPKLVVTGGAVPFITGYGGDEASLYASLLTELLGVPDSSIVRVSESRNTYEDAVETAQLFQSCGWKKDILLVTSAVHMPRAVRLFRKQGFTVYPVPADFRSGTAFPGRWFALLPAEWALGETANALHEYVGLAAYAVMGRL